MTKRFWHFCLLYRNNHTTTGSVVYYLLRRVCGCCFTTAVSTSALSYLRLKERLHLHVTGNIMNLRKPLPFMFPGKKIVRMPGKGQMVSVFQD